MLVEEKERLGSEDAFWSKYTEPRTGNCRLYQSILDELRQRQVERDRTDAMDARRFFSGNLANDKMGRFVYARGAATHICEKEYRIASIWRQILATDTVVAVDWERMKANSNADRDV